MDIGVNNFGLYPGSPSSKALEYLLEQLSELENRIEELEEQHMVTLKTEKALLSKANSIEKKLDTLIKLTENPIAVNSIEDNSGNAQKQAKPKRIAVFIDGENISHKKASAILEKSENRGEIAFTRVYGVQNNNSDKCWIKTSNELNIKHIRLAGGSKKNKVDKKMFEEILKEANKKDHSDTIVIATNDADFAPVVKEARGLGVRVVIMGLKSSLSDKLKGACDSFLYL